MEPGGELRPPRPSRRRILARRTVAVAAIALLLGGGAAAAVVVHGSGPAAVPDTTIRQLRQFRILFPEGFTRAKMAARVGAVAKIAERESHRKVKLSSQAYLAATKRPRVIPGFGGKKLALEAAAPPARVDYLYFVRKPDHKHHYFTDNLQDFLQHEAQYGY